MSINQHIKDYKLISFTEVEPTIDAVVADYLVALQLLVLRPVCVGDDAQSRF